MITLLAKLFIEPKQYDEAQERRAYGILCGIVGILLNAFLFFIKLIAGILSSSVSITADALNNLSDAGSSLVSLLGFKLASHKADAEHPYGHGRMEYIAGLIVSFLIMIMAVELIKSSINKIINPIYTEYNSLIFCILLISILIKIYMILYNRSISKLINSVSLKATAADSMGDVIATSAVFVSALLAYFTSINIDGYCGAIVGLFILYSGIMTAKETSSPLLGASPKKDIVDKINEIVLAEPEILAMHDLIIHDYGPMHTYISLHVEVDAFSELIAIHNVINSIEHKLEKDLNIQAVIHVDPHISNSNIDHIRDTINHLLATIDSSITYHDLQVINNTESVPTISFDVLLPMEYPSTDEEVLDEVTGRLFLLLGKTYQTDIKIDRDYVL